MSENTFLLRTLIHKSPLSDNKLRLTEEELWDYSNRFSTLVLNSISENKLQRNVKSLKSVFKKIISKGCGDLDKWFEFENKDQFKKSKMLLISSLYNCIDQGSIDRIVMMEVIIEYAIKNGLNLFVLSSLLEPNQSY